MDACNGPSTSFWIDAAKAELTAEMTPWSRTTVSAITGACDHGSTTTVVRPAAASGVTWRAR